MSPLCRQRCAGPQRRCRRRGERGGPKEPHRIPDRGEEDKYRGRKVHGGLDEAQRGQEEEEGKSIGGRAWDGVPRASSGAAGDGDGRGPDNRTADAPPSRFVEGVSSPAPHQSLSTRGC
jgi:hypothetical protein